MGNTPQPTPLEALREALASGRETPTSVARRSLRAANANASRNTYLWLDSHRLMGEAAELEARFGATDRPPLYGVPVSLKDCFDVAGTPTTAGTRFYGERNGIAQQDSTVAQRVHAAGALLVGKTHLHPLAYGITGENPEFGDCLQPRDASLLTGGSSSGAAASVQEGSAVVGIGTDTGGSVRVPAALCGLVGYRVSHQLAFEPGRWGSSSHGLWAGGIHLAPSFDTVGFFLRDARDASSAAQALFGIAVSGPERGLRIGCVQGPFLADCDASVLASVQLWREQMTRCGAVVQDFAPEGWENTSEIFSGIQAHEAAALHRGNFDAFEPAIAKRLDWGESIPDAEVARLRQRMEEFRRAFASLFDRFDLLMLPCAPVRRLVAGEDHTAVRGSILRYTTPFSLCGMPALALPGEMLGGAPGSGVQIGARPGEDNRLLAWAGVLGDAVATRGQTPSQEEADACR